VALNEVIEYEVFELSPKDKNALANSITVEIDLLKRTTSSSTLVFDTDHLARVFKSNFQDQILSVNQPLVMDFAGVNIIAKILTVERIVVDANADTASPWALLVADTALRFSKHSDSPIKLTGSVKTAYNDNAIVKPNFKFEDLGIGGLDEEFGALFRRAFVSRIYPAAWAQKLGVKHVRGVLLYGPPGTGKTLIARQIGKMLNAHEPKIVNGPEVLNKFVGQSEENIRNLFKDAEAEYKSKGDESKLHIIIFDELDAICKQRSGKSDGGTGVGDSIVNQLLSKMDGVEQLNNVLVIGMTNRLDLIDDALLRPGRFEVQIEIGLPTQAGRLQIFKIHTAKMRENHALAGDVDLDELSGLSKNFTGAEITGLINSATSFALTRHVKIDTLATFDPDSIDSLQVSRQDFFQAFQEVHAAFGADDQSLCNYIEHGIVDYGEEVERVLNECKLSVDAARANEKSGGLISVLLHGPSGSGKTAIVAEIARRSEFPFVQVISAERLMAMSEAVRVVKIADVIANAYKSRLAMLIVDNLEQLIDYVPIGPRFSNSILQLLQVLFTRRPPNDHSLLVLATSSQKSVMQQLGLSRVFTKQIKVPSMKSLRSVFVVLDRVYSADELAGIRSVLQEKVPGDARIVVSVKKLINLALICRQDSENGSNLFIEQFIRKHVRK